MALSQSQHNHFSACHPAAAAGPAQANTAQQRERHQQTGAEYQQSLTSQPCHQMPARPSLIPHQHADDCQSGLAAAMTTPLQAHARTHARTHAHTPTHTHTHPHTHTHTRVKSTNSRWQTCHLDVPLSTHRLSGNLPSYDASTHSSVDPALPFPLHPACLPCLQCSHCGGVLSRSPWLWPSSQLWAVLPGMSIKCGIRLRSFNIVYILFVVSGVI
jgi:hypothetical protein